MRDFFPVKLTGSGDTILGSVFLGAICVNKVLTGTMVIKETSTALANHDIGTPRGNYHQNSTGSRWANLVITLSAGDDVTAYVCKA